MEVKYIGCKFSNMSRKPSQYFLDWLEEEGKKDSNKIVPCDVSGCLNDGEFRAPKSKSLEEYYNFCLQHVEDYNSEWNFFEGMPQSAVESQMYNDMMWDRPTWHMAPSGGSAERLRQHIYSSFNFGENINFDMGDKDDSDKGKRYVSSSTPEAEAMEVMGLNTPLTWKKIKARYRELAKKHHPDKHGGSNQEEEELLKKINIAYSVLKIAYQKYEALEKE